MTIRDGEWTLHSSDIKRGIYKWSRVNPDGSTTIRTDTVVDHIAEINKQQRNLAEAGWKGDYHMVASVPVKLFWDQLAEASREGDEKYVSRWLNDSDNRAWRTKSGRV